MSVRIVVAVKTKAKHAAITASVRGILIEVMAPPIEGRANDEVRDVLAAALGIPPTRVHMVRGERSRMKAFEIDGIDEATTRSRLLAASAPESKRTHRGKTGR